MSNTGKSVRSQSRLADPKRRDAPNWPYVHACFLLPKKTAIEAGLEGIIGQLSAVEIVWRQIPFLVRKGVRSPYPARFLKPGITFQQFDAHATAMSDNEAAQRLNNARATLFKTICNRFGQPASLGGAAVGTASFAP